MALDSVDLGDLAFSSYIYSYSTKFDMRYQELRQSICGVVHISDAKHRLALLKWLNHWGCRQFSVNQYKVVSESLLQWHAMYADYLPPPEKPLEVLDEKTLKRVSDAYEALRFLTASIRKDGVRMTVGPTGAGKIMFALRPRQLPPWDNPIRKAKGWNGDGHSYFRYLCEVQETIKRLLVQLDSACLDEQLFSTCIGRFGVALPKLIDEYMWMTVTRGIEPPTKETLQNWLSWKSE